MSEEAGPANEAKKPSRALAVVLSIVGPLGIGQFYLGQTRRACFWLGGFVLGVTALTFALVPLDALLGYGRVLAFVMLAAFAGWLASPVDVLTIPETRLKRVRWLAVVGFWLVAWVLSLGMRALIRRYAWEAFKTPSGSMQPTLLPDEHLVAAKRSALTEPPERGETVIFKFPEDPGRDYLKRVVALPGDTLEVKGGHPWINGWEVPHCRVGRTATSDAKPGCAGTLELEFLDAAAYPVFFDECADDPTRKQGPYRVAAGEVWVLGDNRNDSFDSRFWFGGRGGGVPLGDVKARPLFRWFSPTEWSRYGSALAEPRLPQSMAALRSEFERCLSSRPARGKTTPPAR